MHAHKSLLFPPQVFWSLGFKCACFVLKGIFAMLCILLYLQLAVTCSKKNRIYVRLYAFRRPHVFCMTPATLLNIFFAKHRSNYSHRLILSPPMNLVVFKPEVQMLMLVLHYNLTNCSNTSSFARKLTNMVCWRFF